MNFYARVFCSAGSWASFLVTPLPKRLRGGNTASGCPCPLSLSLIIFIVLAFSYVSSCVSRSLVPTLSSPSLFVSAFFAQSVAVVRASHRGTRQNFPSTFLPLFLPLISPQLSSSPFSQLISSFFFSFFLSEQHINPTTTTTIRPTRFPPFLHTLTCVLLMAARVRSETAKCPPRRHCIHKAHRRPKQREGGGRKKKNISCLLR